MLSQYESDASVWMRSPESGADAGGTREWSACGGVATRRRNRAHSTYLICDAATHACHKDDASTVPEPSHLTACCLRREEHAVRVHIHHLRRTRQYFRLLNSTDRATYGIRPSPFGPQVSNHQMDPCSGLRY